jgi:hypothetical protein
MDTTETQLIVVIILQVIHLLERLFYWLFMWSMTVKKSKCVANLCKGCCKFKAEVEEEHENETIKPIEPEHGEHVTQSGQ